MVIAIGRRPDDRPANNFPGSVAPSLICFSCLAVRALPGSTKLFLSVPFVFQKPVDLTRRKSESEARCRARSRSRSRDSGSTIPSPRMRSNSNLCAPCTAASKTERWPYSNPQLVSASLTLSYLLRSDIGAGTVGVSCFSCSPSFRRRGCDAMQYWGPLCDATKPVS
jgi:hypothetical protein